jgi:2-polyprenyl-3-methyl-5-hydroxy-6-metoxy-1,4-benzoquinol methylase
MALRQPDPRVAPPAGVSVPVWDLAKRRAAFPIRHAEYLREGLDRLAAARLVAQLAGPAAGLALDVGTGKGLLAIELARLGLDVVSVDIDSDEQELAALLAREAGVSARIEFVVGNACELPYASGHFGCAAMMDVLHHLDDPRPVLGEMVRAVRPGASIVVADFSREGFEIVARVQRALGTPRAV